MFMLSKAINRFNAVHIKISMIFFTKIEQKFLKFVWNYKVHQIGKTILGKKNKGRGFVLPDLRLYGKAPIIQHYGTGIKQTHKLME